MEEKTKNGKVYIVVIAILTSLLLVAIGFILCNELVKKDNSNNNGIINNSSTENEDEESINIESDLVKNLVYPYPYINENNKVWEAYFEPLENFNVGDTTIEKLLYNASVRLTGIDGKINHCGNSGGLESCNGIEGVDYIVKDEGMYNISTSTENIKQSFLALYGPEMNGHYYDKTIPFNCSVPSYYDSKSNKYWSNDGCGGYETFTYGAKLLKAVHKDDFIYVYVASYAYEYETGKIFDSYYISEKHDTKTQVPLATINESQIDSTVDNLIKENKFKIYKFTFKKQSDGKYYVYSGEWQ